VQQPPKPDVATLPVETINFAHRMFEAARNNDSTILLAAIDAGLPVNLTNDKGWRSIPFVTPVLSHLRTQHLRKYPAHAGSIRWSH